MLSLGPTAAAAASTMAVAVVCGGSVGIRLGAATAAATARLWGQRAASVRVAVGRSVGEPRRRRSHLRPSNAPGRSAAAEARRRADLGCSSRYDINRPSSSRELLCNELNLPGCRD